MSEFARLFLATVLGAAVSFGSTFYFQRRQETLEQRRATVHEQRELRRVLRLLRHELGEGSATISIARESELWWGFPPSDLPVSLWVEWKASLAGLLDDQRAWGFISGAFGEIEDLNQKLAIFRSGRENPNDLATHQAGEPITNEGWTAAHTGSISPQWDDTLMRLETSLNWASTAIWMILFPDQEAPELFNAPSRMEAGEDARGHG